MLTKISEMLTLTASKIAQFVAQVGRGALNVIGKVGNFLAGGNGSSGPAPQMESAEEGPKQDHLAEVMEAQGMLSPYERRIRGLEPGDVKAYLAASNAMERDELGGRLSHTTRTWANCLDAGERLRVIQAKDADLKSHLSGEATLKGVRGFGIVKALRDPMQNPHAPDLASKIINDNRPNRQRTFGRFQAIEARKRAAANANPHAGIAAKIIAEERKAIEANHAGANPAFQIKQARMAREQKKADKLDAPRPPAAMFRANGKHSHLRLV